MSQLKKDLQKVADSEKENPLERLHLAWRLHRLRRHAHLPSLGSPQAFISIIATLLFITGITVWQKSSLRNAQRTAKLAAEAEIDPKEQFQKSMRDGQEKFDEGDWMAAAEQFERFARLKLSPQDETRMKPIVLEQLRDLYYAAERSNTAEDFALRAEEIRINAVTPIVDSVKRQLGAVEKKLAGKNPDQEQIADALGDLNEQAHLCEYLDEYDQAKEILESILKLSLEHLPKQNALIGRTYKNLAYTLWQRGELQQAKEFYEKALVIRRRNRGYFDEDLIRTLRDAAALNIEMGEYTQAHKYLDEAISEAKNSDNVSTPLMAYLHVLRAEVYQARGVRDNVEGELQEATNIYAQTPIDETVFDQKANCLTLIATKTPVRATVKEKMLREAVSLYEQASRKNWADFATTLDELRQDLLLEPRASSSRSQTARAENLVQAFPLIKRAQAILSRLPSWQSTTAAAANKKLLAEYEVAAREFSKSKIDMHPGHISEPLSGK